MSKMGEVHASYVERIEAASTVAEVHAIERELLYKGNAFSSVELNRSATEKLHFLENEAIMDDRTLTPQRVLIPGTSYPPQWCEKIGDEVGSLIEDDSLTREENEQELRAAVAWLEGASAHVKARTERLLFLAERNGWARVH